MSALVTGSDSGIGRATAVALARAGHDVALTWDTDEAGARETATEVEAVGRRAVVGRLDTSTGEAVRAAAGALLDELGGVDVLVNAGTGDSSPFLEKTLEEFEHIVATDLVGAFVVAQECARRMVAAGAGGRIVNVTSVHEHVPLIGSSAYTSSKHGLGRADEGDGARARRARDHRQRGGARRDRDAHDRPGGRGPPDGRAARDPRRPSGRRARSPP